MIFDLFVIGGGSGGMAATRRAASHNAKVAIAERQRWGGTCVNVGCVPKKIMWWASNVSEILHQVHHYGFKLNKEPSFDWAHLKARRDATVLRLNGIHKSNLQGAAITQYEAYASFLPSEGDGLITLKVGEEKVKAKQVLIAVGGTPSKLGVPGEELTINSDQFFELETQPKKVAVFGAGYIAIELAGVFNGLGSETHLFCRGEYVLRKFDDLIQREVTTGFISNGGHLHPGSIPASFEKSKGDKIKVNLQNGESFDGFDCVLVAVGRRPLTDHLNLENIGVETIKGGYIKVDEYQNTSVPNVFALGDVCGKVELTPMAIAAGRRLADRLFLKGHSKAKACYDNVPSVIFSHPPVGSIGMSEKEAKEKFGENDVVVYNGTSVNLYYNVFDMAPTDKPKTRIKMVCRKSDKERVLGLHIVGMASDEMLQGFGVAIRMGATKADMDNCVAIHPSAAEEVVTLPPWGLSATQ